MHSQVDPDEEEAEGEEEEEEEEEDPNNGKIMIPAELDKRSSSLRRSPSRRS